LIIDIFVPTVIMRISLSGSPETLVSWS